MEGLDKPLKLRGRHAVPLKMMGHPFLLLGLQR
jgi:hypothetical protein